jgi:hypothetical protein
MIWHADEKHSYKSGIYRIYATTRGWDCYRWGEKPKRLGQVELMSQAMELAEKDQRGVSN